MRNETYAYDERTHVSVDDILASINPFNYAEWTLLPQLFSNRSRVWLVVIVAMFHENSYI